MEVIEGFVLGEKAEALRCDGVWGVMTALSCTGTHQPGIHSLPHSFIPSLFSSCSGLSSSLWAITLLPDTKLEMLRALILPKPSLDVAM